MTEVFPLTIRDFRGIEVAAARLLRLRDFLPPFILYSIYDDQPLFISCRSA